MIYIFRDENATSKVQLIYSEVKIQQEIYNYDI